MKKNNKNNIKCNNLENDTLSEDRGLSPFNVQRGIDSLYQVESFLWDFKKICKCINLYKFLK